MIEIKLCELYVKLFCGFCGFVLNGLWILCDPCQAVFVLLLSYNTEDSYNSAQEKPSGLHGFADAGGLFYVMYFVICFALLMPQVKSSSHFPSAVYCPALERIYFIWLSGYRN